MVVFLQGMEEGVHKHESDLPQCQNSLAKEVVQCGLCLKWDDFVWGSSVSQKKLFPQCYRRKLIYFQLQNNEIVKMFQNMRRVQKIYWGVQSLPKNWGCGGYPFKTHQFRPTFKLHYGNLWVMLLKLMFLSSFRLPFLGCWCPLVTNVHSAWKFNFMC